MKTRIILLGIGGATCSGKTTLAKHLRRILPNSVIIHQDDFAPPQELIPLHPVYGVQDWDRAEGAIDWPRMVKALEEVKRTGEIPPEHISHDHLNEQRDVPIDDVVYQMWKAHFEQVDQEHRDKGEKVKWVMVDGFLLYWHPEVVEKLDYRVFLRVPESVLKQRRHDRHGYHTAVQSDPEGSLWRDPPNYWEQIVWPAYVEAHEGIVENGDVERGQPNGKVAGLILLDGLDLSMSDMVDRVCGVLGK
ncbi:P-loop containing nucleoside triphosphate hydrolase protein [Trametes versicolor FP-101664 SS1]|uniref:P-loop containing nucleoside triphosphate hydrolase protein n=1 Tax=Trametes versicolor (strain FP-101664) TaxID=717944 RepID=UPI0004623015|nr:P-loop containing nucleoside triphosphate hydrolase protein [Trametes versicolor FP-101664 SS1]EIW62856.1 P-loop containing nucleoside triphosphate hydrolase protein [Trametes versicolor FP-101664 SS1]